jgi:hypothetical protein
LIPFSFGLAFPEATPHADIPTGRSRAGTNLTGKCFRSGKCLVPSERFGCESRRSAEPRRCTFKTWAPWSVSRGGAKRGVDPDGPALLRPSNDKALKYLKTLWRLIAALFVRRTMLVLTSCFIQAIFTGDTETD